MYKRAAIFAALCFVGTEAQTTTKHYCLDCENTNTLGDENTNGNCYFTSTLDTTDLSTSTDAVECNEVIPATNDDQGNPVAEMYDAGQCYMRILTTDGIPQSIKRGCVATGKNAEDTTEGEIATATQLPSGHPKGCDIDVVLDVDGTGLTHLNSVSKLFSANGDFNTLTDATCANTCTASSVGCNKGTGFEFATLDDCGAKCGDVSTCDHWTGVCETFSCPTGQQPKLAGTPQAYICEAVSCSNDCGTDATCSVDIGSNTGELIGDFETPVCVCTNGGVFTGNGADTPGTCGTAPVVTVAPPAAKRMCQQCSSDTVGSSCSDGTVTQTACATSTSKCAAVSTLWIDENGKSIREVVERGCTDDEVVTDTCEFQEINSFPGANQAASTRFSKATEMTCRYVCDSDNCNSELADGVDTTYKAEVSCNVGVKCNSLQSCKTITSVSDITDSSSGCQGRCWSRMKYYQHMRADGMYERALTHLEFGCYLNEEKDIQETCEAKNIEHSGAGFSSKATTDILGGVRTGVTQYDCWSVAASTVSGWPGQPKCFQCDDTDTTDNAGNAVGENWCFTDVDMAAGCPMYYDNACYVKQTGMDLTSNWAQKSMNPYSAMQSMGAPRAIKRGCTSAVEAMTCGEEPVATRDEANNQHLYHDRKETCLTSMCNFGPALPAPGN